MTTPNPTVRTAEHVVTLQQVAAECAVDAQRGYRYCAGGHLNDFTIDEQRRSAAVSLAARDAYLRHVGPTTADIGRRARVVIDRVALGQAILDKAREAFADADDGNDADRAALVDDVLRYHNNLRLPNPNGEPT